MTIIIIHNYYILATTDRIIWQVYMYILYNYLQCGRKEVVTEIVITNWNAVLSCPSSRVIPSS